MTFQGQRILVEKTFLSGQRHFGISELADMLEETEWFPGDFQNALRELVKEGKVRNMNAKRARPVNAINFEKGETLERHTTMSTQDIH